MNKILITLIAFAVAMVMVLPAYAGQEPFVAVIDTDSDYPLQYIGLKEGQWLHPDTKYLCERFVSTNFAPENKDYCRLPLAINIPNPKILGAYDLPNNLKTLITRKGNANRHHWLITLPKKPQGELNITIQCAVLKPSETDINNCAAITGERIDSNCTRQSGTDLKRGALPTLKAVAYPGPNAELGWRDDELKPFHLTAMRNPSGYGFWGYDRDTKHHQVLDGGPNARFALKGCFTKTIFVALPKEGRWNALDEKEQNLNWGDSILVTMNIPKKNTVDIYCHQYSVKINGIAWPNVLPQGSYLAAHNAQGLSCPAIVLGD